MRKLYFALLLMLCMGSSVFAQEQVIVSDNNGAGTGTTTWTNDKTYVLDGFVYVNAGDTLTIEAGTVIKGNPGQGADASALIVARGAYIDAQGTASEPIIFTGLQDDVNNPDDVPPHTTGLWGGVIILGNASLNSTPGETAIEGIPVGETRAVYGGNNDADNSGFFRYVSIRHGGTDIGAGNEINGLTLGGVGSATTIDHVEVIFNADDGIEFFGGTVNTSHMVAAFCADDAFDYDEGFRGKGQFWFVIQSDDAGSDRGGEHDGGTDPETAEPFATPMIYNATYIGRGEAAGRRLLTFRDNAGGEYNNSIFMDFGNGVDIELLASGTHSWDRYQAGDLSLSNNIFWNVAGNVPSAIFAISGGDGVADADIAAAEAVLDTTFAAGGNTAEDPQLSGVSRDRDGGLAPNPDPAGPAYKSLAAYPEADDFIEQVSYKGAFSASPSLWINGWTYLEELGYVAAPEAGVVTVNGSTGSGTTFWSKNNTYLLDGFVFVNPGDTLIIEAGTVIKGLPGAGADASALIVSRGAYIDAQGTAAEPIIFTGFQDDVTVSDDIPPHTTGLWGGVIILGNASLNSAPGETAIEGIPVGEARALYGGNNDEDNSGIFRYVSIRHGGTDIGAGNEINGLTLGGVGSATTVDHVEVIFNADDGIEFFGGTVNTKFMIAAFCADDAFDYDEGFRGKGQYWFVIQSDEAGSDRGGEHDGGTDPETAEPFATPVIFNATYIGRGEAAGRRALTFRDNAGGEYHNSVFVEYGNGVDVEKLASGTHSFDRLNAGDLALKNNIFWNVAGNDPASIFTVAGGTADDQAAIAAYFGANANESVNPSMVSISYEPNGGLDPRVAATAAYDNLSVSEDAFFTPTLMKGAFSAGNIWAKGWTYMDDLGYFPAEVGPINLTTAQVQIIHNSADPAASVVDIYVNGVKAVDDLNFREATPYVDLLANIDLEIAVAPGDSESADDAVATFPGIVLDSAGVYVVMATGVITPDDFNATVNDDIAFTLAVTAGRTAAVDPANVDLQVYHGATDAPVVDVVTGGAVLIDNIAYGSFIPDYASVPAAEYILDVTPAEDNATVVASFRADLSGAAGAAAVVFASGFLDPLANQNGADFALFAALPDGTVIELPEIRELGTKEVSDNTGAGTTVWSADTIYVLNGFVFVNPGDTLVIEPGTIIKGESGQGAEASALVVSRGAYIDAQGTAAAPIIFTSVLDDTNVADDIPAHTTGLWGGVIILGNASLNSAPGETAIEGIPVGEARALYGGDNDEDNSGIFQYVSIRHGGTDIGAGNEINGLTLGGVGSGTTVDHVEVIFNADDGIEFFGGTVNTSYMVAAFCADDAFDYDEGFRGKGQFWFVIQSDEAGSDRGGEHDGGTDPETAEPFATPVIFNATYIGRGEAAGRRALTFRDNAGGQYHNSIFIDYGNGVDIEKLASGTHSFDRFVAGELALQNNVFWNVAGNDPASIFTVAGGTADDQATVATYFGDAGNASSDPAFVSVSRAQDNLLDPRPQAGVAYFDLSAQPDGDDFFMDASYKGAFAPDGLWVKGWTYLEALNYLPAELTPVDPTSVAQGFEAIDGLQVYPNPSNGLFTLKAEELDNTPVRVSVFDLIGNQVYSAEELPVAGRVFKQLNLTNLAPAMYLMKVEQGNKMSALRVIVR